MENTLLREMEASVEEVIREIQTLSEEEFEKRVITGIWTAKEILSHIAAWDLEFINLSRKVIRDERIQKSSDFDTFNSSEVTKRRTLTREEIINEVKRNRKAYIEFLVKISQEQLNEPRKSFTIERLARDIISHDQYHVQQIRQRT
ncbi:MAG: DinB family protein [Theionarchaea archaeon]|nr:DinB family protein [Theionarchaea archaeon]